MQIYNKIFKYMSILRFLMFKMRDFLIFLPKITHFKHFLGMKSHFFDSNEGIIRKISYFCTQQINSQKWIHAYY